jgi:SNF2 family DNA or RNA helicase
MENAMPDDPGMRVGQVVCLRADPSRQGAVLEVLPASGGRARYRVFHSPSDIREYYEEQLVIIAATQPTGVERRLLEGDWLSADVFRARLTATRLSHPQVDALYSLHAARIKYVPFQFKPLLRFLRADRPRLLIADEVGVGKTIEAGLILRELQTRQRVDNVLIVCPKALVPKWRMEMRRFDEDFRPLTPETLRYCLREAHLDGAWPAQYAKAIVNIELLRLEDYLQGSPDRAERRGLLALDPPPRFDLVIVDEAHHVRNPEASSHTAIRFLCDTAEAVLFLSATPLHLGARNLFALLSLLRPDLFPDEEVFREMVEPNKGINEASRHVRFRWPEEEWRERARAALQEAAETRWGRQTLQDDPRFRTWYERLGQEAAWEDAERVRCLRDLEELHTLAHVMNRTRRRDIGRFTVREPHTISVAFTPAQGQFYEALLSFRREVLLLEHDPCVVRLVMDTLERQAASCLPAMVPLLEGFLRTGRFDTREVSDADEGEDDEIRLPRRLVQMAENIRNLGASLPPDDPKFDRLQQIVRQSLDSGHGPGKVLLFSFFLHTLGYLRQRLSAEGCRVGLVSGEVDDEERERLRDRFRLPRSDPNAIDVLLSSEVGCEGLDYEFCDRLVNYDIPWNPMRIEQRIGRIDRFGQLSEKVLIFNFVTPGTVEDRIFYRCFERLGIFRDTVGDMEEVLGDVMQDLTQIALDAALTPEQAEERARQLTDNAIRRVEEQRRMEEEGAALLGLDQALVEEVDAAEAEGRFVSPDDLRHMVGQFLQQAGISGRLAVVAQTAGIWRLRLSKEGKAGLLDRVRALDMQNRATVALVRWLRGGDPHIELTFDQAVALEHRDMAFITPLHPLARVALRFWLEQEGAIAAQAVVDDERILPGRYLYACDLWETVAARPEVRLVVFAWDLDRRCRAEAAEGHLVRLLALSQDPPEREAVDRGLLEEGLRRIEEAADAARTESLVDLRRQNGLLIDRKVASLEAYARNRLRRLEADLAQATDARIVRMKESERDRVLEDRERNVGLLQRRREADILRRRVAAGILICRGT